jgi:hypothetical protein
VKRLVMVSHVNEWRDKDRKCEKCGTDQEVRWKDTESSNHWCARCIIDINACVVQRRTVSSG